MSSRFREWATRRLRQGDLTALAAIARGRFTEEDRIKRLARRGFIAKASKGDPCITTRGRVALVIKRLAPH